MDESKIKKISEIGEDLSPAGKIALIETILGGLFVEEKALHLVMDVIFKVAWESSNGEITENINRDAVCKFTEDVTLPCILRTLDSYFGGIEGDVEGMDEVNAFIDRELKRKD